MPTPSATFLADLRRLVGAEHVLEDDLTTGYAVDWTGRYVGHTPAVVRPGTAEEVVGVLTACAASGIAVVPQGGNTGLVGGGVPLDGEVLLSLKRLQRHDRVDVSAGQVTVGAGVTLAAVQRAAGASGLRYAVDLGARETATVGGTVATNAGGVHVMRFGPTRAQLCGVQAVLADGTLVEHLGGLVKDNTGYDLGGLLCGSEGTLGVVTAARLGLHPQPEHTVVALLGFATIGEALDTAVRLRRSIDGLEAVEVFFDDGLRLLESQLGLAPPFADHPPVYLLVEVTGRTDPLDGVARALRHEPTIDAAVAHDASRRAGLWRYRELHTEAIGTIGVPHKLDISLPLEAIPRFVVDIRLAVADLAADARCWLFGHVLDGNLHVNVTGVPPDDARVDELVLTLVADRGGSISAEHGIGRAKRRWLHLNRTDAEIATFRSIKHALDPDGILNPGVLLPS